MNILIISVAGFVGSNLAKHFVEKREYVIGVVQENYIFDKIYDVKDKITFMRNDLFIDHDLFEKFVLMLSYMPLQDIERGLSKVL